MSSEKELTTLPVAPLKIAALESCRELGQKVDDYIVSFRKDTSNDLTSSARYMNYQKDSYLTECSCPRFGSGEAKGKINESVRGADLYILVDVCNYSITYKVCGYENHMSPDDHYQDLKRIIAAATGKAHRINVIMPFIYEGRQHKRSKRESLDCAMALEELTAMGVSNILTFDAHDPRISNAIPLAGFDDVQATYQMIKALVRAVPDISLNKKDTIVISPDEGGMSRCMYYSSVLKLDLGMFYKRRDYSVIVNGKNPIEAHEYLGRDVNGKDVIIVDDMISSGESVIDVANNLKKQGAKRIFVFASFGLFCNGLECFDKAAADGIVDKIFTTNLIYRNPDLATREWYCEVDMSKYISLLIDTLNHDETISSLLNPVTKIKNLVSKLENK